MARMFIQCSQEETKAFGDSVHKNHPINVTRVNSIQKIVKSIYPDPIGHPGIHFSGIDVEWLYDKGDFKTREYDFYSITNYTEI